MYELSDHPIIQNMEKTGYPYEKEIKPIVCEGCGEYLYDGDYYYPELNICQYCIDYFLKYI